MNLPDFAVLEEKRDEERIRPEFPELISAIFKLAKRHEMDQLFDLNVIDYSIDGLGLLITEKDFDLLQTLNPNDIIPEITFFAAEALTTLDGTVRHITRIEEGKYKDNYILGLRSNTKIEQGFEGSKPYYAYY